MKLIEGKSYFAEYPFVGYPLSDKGSVCVRVHEERRFSKKDTPFKLIRFVNEGESIIEWQGSSYIVPDMEADSLKEALIYDDIRDSIIVKWVTGSRMYGTNIESSDTDCRGVYILPDRYYFAVDFDNDWEEVRDKQIVDGKVVETTYYELRKFLRMLATNNPNIMEALDIPVDCLKQVDPAFNLVIKNKKSLLTKRAYGQFANYATAQIRKATGHNKLQNMEKNGPIVRKDVLDFCYVTRGQGSVPVKTRLTELGLGQEECTASSIDHMPGFYAVYHDKEASHGLINESSTHIRVSNAPRDMVPLFYMMFNDDAWSKHCTDFNRYKVWVSERNEERWVEIKNTDQTIDGKNMLHCVRLIKMAEDIGNGRGIITRRSPEETEYLKSIRRGDVPLEDLVRWSEDKLKEIKSIFEHTDLPDEVDSKFINDLHLMIRKTFDQ